MSAEHAVLERQEFKELVEAKHFTALHIRILDGQQDALNTNTTFTEERVREAAKKTLEQRENSFIYTTATRASFQERADSAHGTIDNWVTLAANRWTADHNASGTPKDQADAFCQAFDIDISRTPEDAKQSVKKFYDEYLSSPEKANLHKIVSKVIAHCTTQDQKIDIEKFKKFTVKNPYWSMFGEKSAQGIQQLLWAEIRQRVANEDLKTTATEKNTATGVMRCNELNEEERHIFNFWSKNGVPQPDQQPQPDNQPPTPEPTSPPANPETPPAPRATLQPMPVQKAPEEPQTPPEATPQPENQDAQAIKREIFETAGKRTLEEEESFLTEVNQVMQEEWDRGKGRMRETFKDMHEVKETIHDSGIVYIPQEQGQLVVIGDLHGDSKTLERILDKSGFFENMARDKNMTLVFMGDYIDRGKKELKTIDIVLGLKKKFKDKIVLLRGNHELDMAGSRSNRDFAKTLYDKYYGTQEEMKTLIEGNIEITEEKIKQVVNNLFETARYKNKLKDKKLDKVKLESLALAFIKREKTFTNNEQEITELFKEAVQGIPSDKVKEFIEDYFFDLSLSFGRILPIYQQMYNQVFENMAYYVGAYNEFNSAHAGPPRPGINNLTELKRDKDRKKGEPTMKKDMVWEDLISQEGYHTVSNNQRILFGNVEILRNSRIRTEIPYLKDLKPGEIRTIYDRLKEIKDTNYCYNPKSGSNYNKDYGDMQALVEAIKYGNLGFTVNAIEEWQQKVGTRIFTRGHEMRNGGDPIPEEAQKYFITLHPASSLKSEEIMESFKAPNPSYGVFDKSKRIDQLITDEHNLDRNIFRVWE